MVRVSVMKTLVVRVAVMRVAVMIAVRVREITADDDRRVHPRRFCYGCNNICTRTERAGKEGKDYLLGLSGGKHILKGN